MGKTADTDTRNCVNIMRMLLNENNENTNVGNEKTDTIPYTKNDELFQKMINDAVKWFGASFTKSKTPLLFDPANGGDVILSGEVPSLGNAVFQFRYRSNNSGIFIWTNELSLTDDVVKTISQINGAGKNWKEYLDTNGDYKPINARDEAEEVTKPLNENINVIRGDDLPSPKRGVVRGDDI